MAPRMEMANADYNVAGSARESDRELWAAHPVGPSARGAQHVLRPWVRGPPGDPKTDGARPWERVVATRPLRYAHHVESILLVPALPRTGRTIGAPIARLAFVLMLTCAACGDDATTSPSVPAPDALGPFAVGHESFTAIDSSRGDRSLPVDVWYPVDPGDEAGAPRTVYELAAGIGLDSAVSVEGAPLASQADARAVVFSHGYGGIRTQSVELMEALASHGFVVASPEHTGNAQSSPTDDFDLAASRRVPDASFVLDVLSARSRDPGDVLFGIDAGRAGVIGHSFGGMTSIGAAAGWAGAPPDPRVSAIAPISAVVDATLQQDTRTGPNAGFTRDQIASISVPMLLVGGTADVGVRIENNRLAFDWAERAPRVYKVDILGATHTHFANVCSIGNLLISIGLGQESWPAVGAEDLLEPYATTCGPDVLPIDEATRLTNLYAVAFFRRHLDGERGYARYLTLEYAAREPVVRFDAR